MLTRGLPFIVCAGTLLLLTVAFPTVISADENGDSQVSTNLAVQTAMQQGREFILRGDYSSALAALEGQLPSINGNRVYLNLLQDAYRKYIQDLRLKKQDVEARRYLQRLLILDKGAILDRSLSGGADIPIPTKAAVAKAN